MKVPVRVDFAGGWLDVPKLARKEGLIINCTITPFVSKEEWRYAKNSGIGGSAAWALLNGENPIAAELGAGVGWQDPAVIMETGLCVWASGDKPKLVCKWDPEFLLAKRLALVWCKQTHVTADLVQSDLRDYDMIVDAGRLAYLAVRQQSSMFLRQAIETSYAAQMKEGMKPLWKVNGAVYKYCGSGWGGYAVYYFDDPLVRDKWVKATPNAMAVEPYFIHRWEELGSPSVGSPAVS